MIFKVGIEVNLPRGGALTAKEFANLSAAVQHLVSHAHGLWVSYAQGAPLPDGTRVNARTGAYAKSIIQSMTGEFAGEASTSLPYARVIEDGAPARDLKKMLDTSLKVRLTKTGKRYLIIPFRHGTPGAVGMGGNVMSAAVHQIVSGAGFQPSRAKGVGSRSSGTGAWDIKTRAPAQVANRQYLWGDRLKLEQIHATGTVGEAAKRMAGMVKMQNAGGKGGGKHTQYLPFRVMVEGSPGWLVPAQPGKHVARQVADQVRPLAQSRFAAAIKADIEARIGS